MLRSWTLPVIVISQFCCGSLWFAGNGVMDDLIVQFDLGPWALGHLTSAVQFGFIAGTLVFASLSIADRFSPSKVFFSCALLGALLNLGTIWEGNNFFTLLAIRGGTGFFLAGIYPVGMKIAADYYQKGLGKSLGYLVGALVVGTAFPHLAKDLTGELDWNIVLQTTSGIAVSGGIILVSFVPDGPFRKPGQGLDLTAFIRVFGNSGFRSPAFGYFGHMWELYSFWAFVPVMVGTYLQLHPQETYNIPLIAFMVIGLGGVACVIGGYLSMRYGPGRVATAALVLSGCCCLISPVIFIYAGGMVFIGFLIFWGLVVVADSPLFSTLVANNAPDELKGTALTIVNCIGFSITIVSLQLIGILWNSISHIFIYMILAIGPALGILAMLIRKKPGSLV